MTIILNGTYDTYIYIILTPRKSIAQFKANLKNPEIISLNLSIMSLISN